MKFFKSIKARLTLWYLIAIVALLLVFGTTAYLMLARSLYQNLDNSLQTRMTELQAKLTLERGLTVFAAQPGEVLLVYDSNGNLMQQLGLNVELNNIDNLVNQAANGQSSYLTTTGSDGQEVRLYAVPFDVTPFSRVVLVDGQQTANIMYELVAFRRILAISGLVVIVLGGLGGWFLASRVLKPVDRITRTAQRIGESDLSRRIDVKNDDELGRLASTLNRMIERLEAAFNRQRQFTADASHELRTPLAVMQAESSLALSKDRSEDEYHKSLEVVSQEVAYMSAVIDKLLFLARSDAGKEPLHVEEVNLKEVFSETFSDAEVLAKDKGLHLSLGSMESLVVKGDRVKLRQLFLNILENAVRYTPDGGSISGSIISNGGTARVAISDTGIGIPPEHLPHIFERFYRVDKARSRAEGGTGLGLAIAQYVAQVHGGKIEVESQVGQGSTFTVVLPLNGTTPV